MDENDIKDESILEQIERIGDEVSAQPLISELRSPAFLLSQYREGESSQGFIRGIKYLEQKYASMRCVRGDGNCFYR